MDEQDLDDLFEYKDELTNEQLPPSLAPTGGRYFSGKENKKVPLPTAIKGLLKKMKGVSDNNQEVATLIRVV